jgi:cystathionine beta-lyase/cystathionine gamma-synthase
VDLSYILNHLGEDRESWRGAVSADLPELDLRVSQRRGVPRWFPRRIQRTTYTRGNNPTVEILRKKVAALRRGRLPDVRSSAGAISAAVMASVSAGDHVVCVQRPGIRGRAPSSGTLLGRFGVTSTFVDGRHRHIERALTAQTKLIVLESPNSMTFEQQDCRRRATHARARSARCATTAMQRR